MPQSKWSGAGGGGGGGGLDTPVSATDNAVVRWDTDETAIQNSELLVSDVSGEAMTVNPVTKTGAGENGTDLTIQAGSKSTNNGTGGALILKGGDGQGTTGGDIELHTGLNGGSKYWRVYNNGTIKILQHPNYTEIYNDTAVPSLALNADNGDFVSTNFTNYTLYCFADTNNNSTAAKQFDLYGSDKTHASASGNGGALAIRAGNAAGSGTGGALTLAGGTSGSGTAGAVTVSTAGTARIAVDGSGNVCVGTASLATTATNGFAYIPSCAGAPTGVPTAKAGYAPLVCDSTNNKLYAYLGGAWVAMN